MISSILGFKNEHNFIRRFFNLPNVFYIIYIDGSTTSSPTPGILQARTLEWVTIYFSSAWKWKVKVKLLSRARLLATPWTAAHQAPPSMGFFQAIVLEWGAIAFSISCFSHVQFFATLWTEADLVPLSMWFSRQENWSGLPCPPPGEIFPTQGSNLHLLHLTCIGCHIL